MSITPEEPIDPFLPKREKRFLTHAHLIIETNFLSSPPSSYLILNDRYPFQINPIPYKLDQPTQLFVIPNYRHFTPLTSCFGVIQQDQLRGTPILVNRNKQGDPEYRGRTGLKMNSKRVASPLTPQ